MKLVIDIPDKMYNTFRKGNWSATYDGKKIRDVVMNGTPLPKGHGRLIYAKDVGEYLTLADVPTIIEADKEG